MGESARILAIQFLFMAAGRRETRGAGACRDKTPILPLRGDDAYIVGRGAALCAGVFHDVQTGARAEGRVTLFKLDKAASGA